MLCYNLGNETSDAGHIKCSHQPQIPQWGIPSRQAILACLLLPAVNHCILCQSWKPVSSCAAV